MAKLLPWEVRCGDGSVFFLEDFTCLLVQPLLEAGVDGEHLQSEGQETAGRVDCSTSNGQCPIYDLFL